MHLPLLGWCYLLLQAGIVLWLHMRPHLIRIRYPLHFPCFFCHWIPYLSLHFCRDPCHCCWCSQCHIFLDRLLLHLQCQVGCQYYALMWCLAGSTGFGILWYVSHHYESPWQFGCGVCRRLVFVIFFSFSAIALIWFMMASVVVSAVNCFRMNFVPVCSHRKLYEQWRLVVDPNEMDPCVNGLGC